MVKGSVRELLARLYRKRGGFIGFLILLVIILCAIFAPYIAPYGPAQTNPVDSLTPPGSDYLLGTDQFGRDVFSRILFGARLSLQIGLVAVGIGTIVGTTVGMLSGYIGGWFDNIMMRFMDILLSFPGILLALIMVVMLGPGMYNLMIAVGISAIPRIARLVRGSVLSVKETSFVEAARATGSSDVRIMIHHVLPNVLAPLMIYATLRVGTAILSAASLSYLGLGATPPTPEWGLMAAGGRKFLRTSWWLSIFPGISIGLVVVSLNMLGDALRDILDPRFQQ